MARIAAGAKVRDAMASVGRAEETYKDWRKTDPVFRDRLEKIRLSLDAGVRVDTPVPDFPEFSERYLNTRLPEHHLRVWDFVSGRGPRSAHPSMQVQWASDDPTGRMIVNIPPDHAKSTTWTVNYVVWRIQCDPSIRVIIVSKTQTQAKKFLLSIKNRLVHPAYEQMHAAFAPEGGWRDEDLPWREDMIYVRGRDPQEKDPTVQAIGVKGAIYGARADLIVMDDIADLTNYADYDNQATWIGQEVDSRLVPEGEDGAAAGRLLIFGTRVGPVDIYKHLRDARPLDEDEATYSYFSQPAILEGEASSRIEDWVVLWPERQTPKHIKRRRGSMPTAKQFNLVFQQDDVSEESTFRPEAVRASINGQRYPGPMTVGATGHRARGMAGLYVVGGWDPASSAGHNAMVVAGIDTETQKRWVLDAWNKRGALPRDSTAKLQEFTETYGIREWRIEKNAVQEYIVQQDELRNWLASRGVRLTPHYTHGNKWDKDIGVETLSPLFDSCVDVLADGRVTAKPKGSGLIELPHAGKNPAIQELANQLTSWEPDNRRQVQDLVMALWFTELGMRQYLFKGVGSVTHMSSRFTSRGAIARRSTASLDELHEKGLIRVI